MWLKYDLQKNGVHNYQAQVRYSGQEMRNRIKKLKQVRTKKDSKDATVNDKMLAMMVAKAFVDTYESPFENSTSALLTRNDLTGQLAKTRFLEDCICKTVSTQKR